MKILQEPSSSEEHSFQFWPVPLQEDEVGLPKEKKKNVTEGRKKKKKKKKNKILLQ